MKHALQHLLVIHHASDQNHQALQRAVMLAQQHRSKLTIFKSCYQQLQTRSAGYNETDDDLAVFVRQQQQLICQQLSTINNNLSDFDIVISWREAEKTAVARLIKQHDISMVISLQQNARGLRALIPSGLEHYLISDCPLPVWLVKPSTADKEMRILACLNVDMITTQNDQLNEVILDLGCELAQQSSEQLHVINCYCPDNYSMSLPYNAQSGFVPQTDVAGEHQRKLQPYLQQHQLPPSCLHLSEGLPDDEIPRTASELHSQLAIIGNNHTHSLASVVLGDTAHYLCKHTPCDVLIVKPAA